MKRWLAAVLLALGGLAATSGARAADAAVFERVHQRLSLAAGPWCDRSSELGVDGQRRCRLRVKVFDDAAIAKANAMQMFDAVALTRPMLERLDEAELAVVLGHEIAHLALGHARQRLAAAAAAAAPEQRRALGLMDDWIKASTPEGHPDTPVDPREREFDADALGLLLAMRAGYPAAAGERLFQRAATALPGWEAAASASHPAPAERAGALRRHAERWCALIAAGEPLLPTELRLLPLAGYRQQEARESPAAKPPREVCDGLGDAAAASPTPGRPRMATPFAQPFNLGRHAPDGPCPHCNPR